MLKQLIIIHNQATAKANKTPTKKRDDFDRFHFISFPI